MRGPSGNSIGIIDLELYTKVPKFSSRRQMMAMGSSEGSNSLSRRARASPLECQIFKDLGFVSGTQTCKFRYPNRRAGAHRNGDPKPDLQFSTDNREKCMEARNTNRPPEWGL
ncbi:hypothetical protein AVEN_237170-1 [Araneus ventricosus]|uniref:Uncharacterized protein n=1 Tax=Araneus ventricosus TaxID=182803 RepID=A0A4Y2T7P6_ARAVE|nr:hypothetical protein AVEN_237170-1 [Araneus ventricosus]